jgi:hypothetical protein
MRTGVVPGARPWRARALERARWTASRPSWECSWAPQQKRTPRRPPCEHSSAAPLPSRRRAATTALPHQSHNQLNQHRTPSPHNQTTRTAAITQMRAREIPSDLGNDSDTALPSQAGNGALERSSQIGASRLPLCGSRDGRDGGRSRKRLRELRGGHGCCCCNPPPPHSLPKQALTATRTALLELWAWMRPWHPASLILSPNAPTRGSSSCEPPNAHNFWGPQFPEIYPKKLRLWRLVEKSRIGAHIVVVPTVGWARGRWMDGGARPVTTGKGKAPSALVANWHPQLVTALRSGMVCVRDPACLCGRMWRPFVQGDEWS